MLAWLSFETSCTSRRKRSSASALSSSRSRGSLMTTYACRSESNALHVMESCVSAIFSTIS